jgi:uncharacterized membrane protein SirB2
VIAYYLGIKHAHVTLVLLSGGLFALRGLLAVVGRPQWARLNALRYLSWSIDSLLLTAALMLLVVLKLNPFTTPWLATKLVLLVAYIVLGTLALAREASPLRRRLGYLAALACFASMYGVARAHQPLGFFAALLS